MISSSYHLESNLNFVTMYYILGIIILIVVWFIYLNRSKGETSTEIDTKPEEKPHQIVSDCCGAHEICEFDATFFDEEQIVYFDDEELDELRNIREEDFTRKNIDDLREVLYTLQTNEIGKWLTSLSRRHIHLPAILQQEARQLIAEKD